MLNEQDASGFAPRVALVTGASRGIGKAIAIVLAESGHTVFGTATTEQGAAAISDYLSAYESKKTNPDTPKNMGLVMDVAVTESVELGLSKIKELAGMPLILVNNAGITQDNLLLRMKEADWDQVVNTNLSSVFRMTKAVLKGMTKARWGRIINISSVVASMGNAGQVNYAAAKAGMEGYARSLAKEVGSRGITVNSVAPGFIRTDMTDALSEQQQEAMLTIIPANRLGKPEEVAAAVDFLSSESAAYINGQILHINGGMHTV